MELARDIMTSRVITLRRRDSIRRAMATFIEHRISGAPVVDEDTGAMVGLISEYDLILAMHSLGAGSDVQDAMKTAVFSVDADTSIDSIAEMMLLHKIRRVPVVNESGQPVGIVSRRDVLRAYVDDAPASVRPTTMSV